MKREKQVNESKQMILDGFIRLLDKQAYDEITISDIANEAGVVRMTLYRHFKEKEDILLFLFEQNLTRAIRMMEETENSSLLDLLIFRFQTLKESPYTEVLAKHKKLDKLFQTIGIEFMPYFKRIRPDIEGAYQKAFLAGGIDAMTKVWIEGGRRESPEVMAKLSIQIVKLFQSEGMLLEGASYYK